MTYFTNMAKSAWICWKQHLVLKHSASYSSMVRLLTANTGWNRRGWNSKLTVVNFLLSNLICQALALKKQTAEGWSSPCWKLAFITNTYSFSSRIIASHGLPWSTLERREWHARAWGKCIKAVADERQGGFGILKKLMLLSEFSTKTTNLWVRTVWLCEIARSLASSDFVLATSPHSHISGNIGTSSLGG